MDSLFTTGDNFIYAQGATMRTIRPTKPAMDFLESMEFTRAILEQTPEATDLAGAFEEALVNAEAILALDRKATRLMIQADALVSISDRDLDRELKRCAAHTLIFVDQNRNAPLFKRFFPKSPSALIRLPLRQECQHSLNVIVAEITNMEDNHPLKPFGETLETAANKALQALETRLQSNAERGRIRGQIEEWKEGINRLRMSTYAELLKRATDDGLPKSWAESFFR